VFQLWISVCYDIIQNMNVRVPLRKKQKTIGCAAQIIYTQDHPEQIIK